MSGSDSNRRHLVLLPGDGIGPEVMAEAVLVLEILRDAWAEQGIQLSWEEALMGGIAVDETGSPLPAETLARCQASDAVVLACVGGPRWDNETAERRPETGLLALRKGLGVFANIRPIRVYGGVASNSPLRNEIIDRGIDMVIFRELTGGAYFGEPRGRSQIGPEEERAVDSIVYTTSEIRRISELAFQAARRRGGRVTSVDKANVLESSRLWRQVVNEVAKDYPDVPLDHQLVDSTAMRLVTHPETYDVVLTENLFGDILSDLGGVLTGSLGMLPSASLGSGRPGLFEPVHGSAPDIAGQGLANPLGLLLSMAMMLEYSLDARDWAVKLEDSVLAVLGAGLRTGDIWEEGCKKVSTREMGDAVRKELQARLG